MHNTAARVRKLRRELGLTQPEFAKRLGVTVAAIQHWENERREPGGSAKALFQLLERNAEIAEMLV